MNYFPWWSPTHAFAQRAPLELLIPIYLSRSLFACEIKYKSMFFF